MNCAHTDPHNSRTVLRKENEACCGWDRGRLSTADDLVASTCTSVLNAVLPAVFRFWHKVLYDLGASALASLTAGWSIPGLYSKLTLTPMRGSYVPAEQVMNAVDRFVILDLTVGRSFQNSAKIGKSLKNSVSPDEICDAYRAKYASRFTRSASRP